MKRPYKTLNETAHEVAETIGVGMDDEYTLTGVEWSLDGCLIFRFYCNGIEFALEVKDADRHFSDTPTGHDGKRPQLFKQLCGANKTNPMPFNKGQRRIG
jgi:hypothetical protein